MATRGSSATATGLALTMIAVGAGVSFALLLSFAGVVAGASLIFVGVRVTEDPTAPTGRPGVLGGGVLCLRRNLPRGVVGLLLSSVAATAMPPATADRETGPVLCFSAFALLLLGLSLLNIGVILGEQD